MREYRKFLERLRRHSNEVENDLIDELLAGRVGRREFLRQRAAAEQRDRNQSRPDRCPHDVLLGPSGLGPLPGAL